MHIDAREVCIFPTMCRGSTIRNSTPTYTPIAKGSQQVRIGLSPTVVWTKWAIWPLLLAVIFEIAAISATFWWLFAVLSDLMVPNVYLQNLCVLSLFFVEIMAFNKTIKKILIVRERLETLNECTARGSWSVMCTPCAFPRIFDT
jgi:hypothetical protein